MTHPIPMGDRLLIEQEKKELSKSGLVLSKEAEEEYKLPKGKVLAVGNGETVRDLGFQAGDLVYFNAFSGERVEIDGIEYLVLRAHEVLARARREVESDSRMSVTEVMF